MVKHLFTAFSQLEEVEVLVIGDLMRDVYTTGRVSRISPEAPVPVLHAQEERALPGGAGNVMLGLVAMGAKVRAMGRIGADISGDSLITSLEERGIDISGVMVQGGYFTPEKRRIIADAHHLLRIDHEELTPLTSELEDCLIAHFQNVLAKVAVVAISDYGKGFLTPRLLKALIGAARSADVPVLVDPKGADFSKYRGATLIKPNLKEAYLASNCQDLDAAAEKLLLDSQSEYILITRSEDGMSLFSQSSREDFATDAKEIKDVTGAGDTVLATLAMGLGSGLPLAKSCQLANSAASVAIEHIGCLPVTLSLLAERLLKNNSNTKVFEEHHLFALKELLKNSPFTLLGMREESIASIKWIDTIQNFSDEKLILYVPEKTPDHYLTLLSSLKEISFLILGSQSLSTLCSEIGPKRVLIYEKEELHELDEALVLLERLATSKV